jgi:TATA-box binding protein (TBP) (component of TFIID and TFIIIB)
MILEEFTTGLEFMNKILPEQLHISTMTFTTSLERANDTLYAFLMSVTPCMLKKRGFTTIPNVKKSLFSNLAFDIQFYPDIAPEVRARVFSTTGSVVITGCKTHLVAFLVVEDLERMFGVPVRNPEPRLVNVNFSIHIPLDIHTIATNIKNSVSFVELPEQYSNRLIIGTPYGKIQIFGSGKIVIHASTYHNVAKTWACVSSAI